MSIAGLRRCAATHLARYTAADGDRAFRTYDRMGAPAPLTPLDCLAPALLSVRIGWQQAVLDGPECAEPSFLDPGLDDADGPWALVAAAIRASGGLGHGNPGPA